MTNHQPIEVDAPPLLARNANSIVVKDKLYYYAQIRINTDISFDYLPYISNFRQFLSTKRTILGVIGGHHVEHTKRPHVHVNFLLDAKNPWRNKSCTMRYNFLRYLEREGIPIAPIKGNEMCLKYEEIEKKTKWTYVESVRIVMGYPLKEDAPMNDYLDSFQEVEIDQMTQVAKAYWIQIAKAKDHKKQKQEKKLNEKELMFKYLDENLVIFEKYIPKIDALNAHEEDLMDTVGILNSKPLLSTCKDPKVLLKNVRRKIIRFYMDYDLEKMPSTPSALRKKAILYMFSKNYIDENEYDDILNG